MSVKITSLELENVKRIKAVKLEPSQSGLTIIGGNNNQGKTSVLDAIMWALGGDKYKPTTPAREGSMVEPRLKVTLSNGLIVERTGKNSSLKVTDPSGTKSGQKLLDSFISQFALDLPKFMDSSDKDKANTLLQIIGVEAELKKLDNEIKATYDERTAIGRIATQKEKHADEMVQWDNVPDDLISASELIKEQQEILARNGENQRKRHQLSNLKATFDIKTEKYNELLAKIKRLEAEKEELSNEIDKLSEDIETASKTVNELVDESTAELERSLETIEATNAKIRDNLEKARAKEEAKSYRIQYSDFTDKLEELKKERMSLLNSAKLPLPGLGIEDGSLTYKGKQWDCMSGSEQMIVAASIVRKLNPQCGFVLIDKLEQMDLQTLDGFGAWLEQEGLQAIGTRVSQSDECSIFIEDGYSIDKFGNKTADTEIKPATAWKAGEF